MLYRIGAGCMGKGAHRCWWYGHMSCALFPVTRPPLKRPLFLTTVQIPHARDPRPPKLCIIACSPLCIIPTLCIMDCSPPYHFATVTIVSNIILCLFCPAAFCAWLP